MRFRIMSGIVVRRAHWFTCGQTPLRRPRPPSPECRLEVPCEKAAPEKRLPIPIGTTTAHIFLGVTYRVTKEFWPRGSSRAGPVQRPLLLGIASNHQHFPFRVLAVRQSVHPYQEIM